MRRSFVLMLAVIALLGQAFPAETHSGWDALKGPSGAWVYVVLAGYQNIEARLKSAAGFFGPEAVAEIEKLPDIAQRDVAKRLNLPPDSVDLGKPLGIAIFNPMTAENPAAAMATFAPLKPGLAVPEGVEVANGYVVVSDSQALRKRLSPAFKAAGGIAPPQGMARIYVDFGAAYQAFGPMIQMSAAMAMNQVPGPNAQVGLAFVQTFFSVIGQIESFSVDLDVVGNDIQAVAVVNAKPGTDIAQLCSNQTGGTALGHIVGKGDITFSGKVNGLGGWGLRLADGILEKLVPDPAESDAVRSGITDFVGNMSDEVAVSYSFTPDGLAVDTATGFKGTLDDARKYWKLLISDKTQSSFKKLMAMGADDVKLGLAEASRQLGGVAVDRFTVDFNAPKNLGPAEQKQLEAMWGPGGMTGEYAVAGGKLLSAFGGKDLSQRLDLLIAKAQGPAGAPEQAPVLASIDVLQIAAWGSRIAGKEPSAELAAGGAPITAAVTFSGRSLTKRVSIPLETAARLKRLIESFEVGTATGAAPRPRESR